jgi:hypothetical protein
MILNGFIRKRREVEISDATINFDTENFPVRIKYQYADRNI